jgi:hypothetical protein
LFGEGEINERGWRPSRYALPIGETGGEASPFDRLRVSGRGRIKTIAKKENHRAKIYATVVLCTSNIYRLICRDQGTVYPRFEDGVPQRNTADND